jgi:hypothetical protein
MDSENEQKPRIGRLTIAKVAAGAILLLLGLTGLGVFLSRQGVQAASTWITIIGFFVSTILAVAGLLLAFLTWRQSHDTNPGSTPPMLGGSGHVSHTGDVKQRNRGSGANVANTGIIGGGSPSQPGVTNTGHITQDNIGGVNVANTGLIGKLDDSREA